MYPNKHKQIVTSLMDGRFITIDESNFDIIKEHQDFYVEFKDWSNKYETYDLYRSYDSYNSYVSNGLYDLYE